MPREKSVHYETIKQMLLDGHRLRDIYQKLKGQISRQRVGQIKDQIISEHSEIDSVYQETKSRIDKEREEIVNKCVQLTKEKYNVTQISEKLSISEFKVYYYLNQAGVRPANKSKTSPCIPEGSIYGKWLIGKMVDERDNSGKLVRYYQCVCSMCSGKYLVKQSHLLQGRSKSCVKCSPKLRKQPKL